MVNLEEREGLGGHVFGDGAVAAHLGPVAHALQQAVRQTGRTARAPRYFQRALLVDGHVQDSGRPAHDERQLLGRVVLQAEGHAEAVAQRAGEQARARGGSDEREARQIEADGAGRRPLAHHDVQLEIFQRRVQHLLHHAVQAVDLVDEQHVALFEVREDGGQVPRAGDSRPRGGADGSAQLVGHHRGERGLAQARRPREQNVVGHIAPGPGRVDHNAERFLHLGLTQVVVQPLRPQREIQFQVVFGEGGGHSPLTALGRRAPRRRAALGHVPDALYVQIKCHGCLSLSVSQTFQRIL